MSGADNAGCKVCNGCGTYQLLARFSKKKSSKDGLSSRCRACASVINAKWRAENPDKVIEHNKQWHAANRDRANARRKANALANPERESAAFKVWFESNRDRKVATNKIWRQKNRERLAALMLVWQRANKDRVQNLNRKWKEKNKLALACYDRNRKARLRASDGSHTRADIKTILEMQRWKCGYCKVSLKAGYQIDHIMPIALGGSNRKQNLQALCRQCNLSKGARHPIEHARVIGVLV